MDEYKDRATFVHLYGPEPHPVAPGTNFDHGVQVNSFWSTVRQPTTYEDRLDMVGRVRNLLHPDQVCFSLAGPIGWFAYAALLLCQGIKVRLRAPSGWWLSLSLSLSLSRVFNVRLIAAGTLTEDCEGCPPW